MNGFWRVIITLGLTLMSTGSVWSQSIAVSGPPGTEVPEEYLVEDGDTLWDVCDYYFGEPRQWPTVWALNPHVTNPHWIYPGDVLRLRMPVLVDEDGVVVQPFDYTIGSEDARQVSITEGLISKVPIKPLGHLKYSPHTQRYLALDDLVYVSMDNLEKVRVGQRFSVYKKLGMVSHPGTEEDVGEKVRIMGIVEVETLDENVARARVVAAFNELERGMPITDVLDHYVEVNPRQNLIDLQGTVVDALDVNHELAQFDTVFIDLGAKDGVQIGNRFFVMRRGDGRLELKQEENRRLPWEQIGEAMVVAAEDRHSTALITRSALEIRRGDRVIMQRHY